MVIIKEVKERKKEEILKNAISKEFKGFLNLEFGEKEEQRL